MKKLSESTKTKSYKIVHISDEVSIKTLEVGLFVGTRIKLIQHLPFNGGTLIEFGDFNLRLAVNNEDSSRILIA